MARPPTMGAATRFMTPAPVPIDHMMGMRPSIAAITVPRERMPARAEGEKGSRSLGRETTIAPKSLFQQRAFHVPRAPP